MDDGGDQPSLDLFGQADIEIASSLEELAEVCTVPLWLPQPWPERFSPPTLTFARWREDAVDYNIRSDWDRRPALGVSGSNPIRSATPGLNFWTMPELPWNAWVADDRLDREGRRMDRCWGWMEPPGVRVTLRGDGVTVDELVEIMSTLSLAPRRSS